MNIIKAFIPLSKVDDEQRMVFGYASTESIDSQGEIVLRAAIEDALPEYMRFGNIREMHTMSAVGVAKSAEVDDKGLYIAAKVVDAAAWEKVKEGVYKGFSIGGRALAKADGVIKKMRLTEISLVDRPANPECVLDAWKADGMEADDGADDVTLRLPVDVAKALSNMTPEQIGELLAKGAQSPEGDQPADEATQQSAQQDPPAAEGGKGGPAAVEKGMWNANRLLGVLDAFKDTCLVCDYEAKNGEHSDELKAAMQGVLKALAEVAQKYVGEEIQVLLGNPQGDKQAGEGEGDVAKRGARFSKATKATLKGIHDQLRACEKAMTDMGYETAEEDDDTGKADADSPLAKSLEAEVADVVKAAGLEVQEGALWADVLKASIAEVGKLRAKVAELEAKPVRKAAVTAVPKDEDTNGNEAVSKGPDADPNDPLGVFKAALSQPRFVSVR